MLKNVNVPSKIIEYLEDKYIDGRIYSPNIKHYYNFTDLKAILLVCIIYNVLQ